MLKKTAIPVITLIILLILFIVLKRAPGSRSMYSTATGKKVITNFESDQAMRIEISQQDKQLVLTREQDKWFVSSAFNYPANQEKISALLNKVNHLKESDIASRNTEKHAMFEVDAAQGKLLKIYNSKQELLADFYVGKMGHDYQSTYLRLHNANDVIIVDAPLMWLVTLDTKQWLDRTLFKCDVKDITQITLKSTTITDTELITLFQDDKQEWTIITPTSYSCDKSTATELAQGLSNLELENVVPITDLAVYGLEQPQRSITVQLKSRSQRDKILIGKTTESGDYYVKNDASPFVVVVRKDVINRLSKKLEDLIDRTLTKFEQANVTELTLTYPQTEIAVTKNDAGNWLLQKPEEGPAQKDTVTFIINTLANLRANSATMEKDIAGLELETPQLKIMVKLKDGSTQGLLIGRKKDDQLHYVKKADSPTIYLLTKHYVETLSKKLENFKIPTPPTNPPEPPKKPDSTEEKK